MVGILTSRASPSGGPGSATARAKLVAGLEMLVSKQGEIPRRKHGNVPL